MRSKIVITILIILFITTFDIYSVSANTYNLELNAGAWNNVGEMSENSPSDRQMTPVEAYVIWMLVLIAFLKAAQKLDDLLNKLGLNVTSSGGGLARDIMIAGMGLKMATKGFSSIRGGLGSGGGEGSSTATSGAASGPASPGSTGSRPIGTGAGPGTPGTTPGNTQGGPSSTAAFNPSLATGSVTGNPSSAAAQAQAGSASISDSGTASDYGGDVHSVAPAGADVAALTQTGTDSRDMSISGITGIAQSRVTTEGDAALEAAERDKNTATQAKNVSKYGGYGLAIGGLVGGAPGAAIGATAGAGGYLAYQGALHAWNNGPLKGAREWLSKNGIAQNTLKYGASGGLYTAGAQAINYGSNRLKSAQNYACGTTHAITSPSSPQVTPISAGDRDGKNPQDGEFRRVSTSGPGYTNPKDDEFRKVSPAQKGLGTDGSYAPISAGKQEGASRDEMKQVSSDSSYGNPQDVGFRGVGQSGGDAVIPVIPSESGEASISIPADTTSGTYESSSDAGNSYGSSPIETGDVDISSSSQAREVDSTGDGGYTPSPPLPTPPTSLDGALDVVSSYDDGGGSGSGGSSRKSDNDVVYNYQTDPTSYRNESESVDERATEITPMRHSGATITAEPASLSSSDSSPTVSSSSPVSSAVSAPITPISVQPKTEISGSSLTPSTQPSSIIRENRTVPVTTTHSSTSRTTPAPMPVNASSVQSPSRTTPPSTPHSRTPSSPLPSESRGRSVETAGKPKNAGKKGKGKKR